MPTFGQCYLDKRQKQLMTNIFSRWSRHAAEGVCATRGNQADKPLQTDSSMDMFYAGRANHRSLILGGAENTAAARADEGNATPFRVGDPRKSVGDHIVF